MNRMQGLEMLGQVILRLRHRRDLVWLLAGAGGNLRGAGGSGRLRSGGATAGG